MKLFLIALLAAISYAQTDSRRELQECGACAACLFIFPGGGSSYCIPLNPELETKEQCETSYSGIWCVAETTTTTTTTTTTVSKAGTIAVVVGLTGYTEENKDTICTACGTAIAGVVTFCDRDGPNQRRTLQDEVDLYLEMTVFDVEASEGFIRSGGYMNALPATLPSGVTTVHADTYADWSISSSYGDPIVWTFGGDCYDLNQDGYYLASSNKHYDHEVYVSVYNHYMREIQVKSESGEIMLSVSNMGEVINNNYPFYFKEEMKKCDLSADKCTFFYKEIAFDAQEFEFVIQILPHLYEDPSLADGETGIHLDIYPNPYPGFNYKEYDGLYFNNPIPETSGTCPA